MATATRTLVGTALNLGEEMKVYPQVLTLFIKPQIWPFHVVLLHVQGVQSYCFCRLNMQICAVLVAVAVVVA